VTGLEFEVSWRALGPRTADLLEKMLVDQETLSEPYRNEAICQQARALLDAMRPLRLSVASEEGSTAAPGPSAEGPAGGAITLTDEALRERWRAAGGSFHGPNVEHGIMAEARLLPFLRALATSQNEIVPVIAEALRRAHPIIKPTTEDKFEFGATVDAHQSICEEVADALGRLSRDFDREAFLSAADPEESAADPEEDDFEP
jgi:hypothetical protein